MLKPNKILVDAKIRVFESRISARAFERLPDSGQADVQKCVERKHQAPCYDDHQFKQKELEIVGEISKKNLCLARIG